MAALGNTNISIGTVQSALGVYSTSSLGALIAKASIGGVGGYAFFIYETRDLNANQQDGYLIAGARPFWNIFSNKIPAEWDYSTGAMELRLKRNALNNNGGYDFRLHDFRGYDHSAIAPEFSTGGTYPVASGAVTISWLVLLHQLQLPAAITHILMEVTIGGVVNQVLMPVADLDEDAPVTMYDTDFTGVTATSGSMQLYASNAASTKLATLTNIFPAATFNISPLYAYLIRMVGSVLASGISVTGVVTIPTGTGNIQYDDGTTSLTNIRIRITAESSIYTTCSFNLYFSQTGESDLLVGNYTEIAVADPAATTDLLNVHVTPTTPIAGGDALSFYLSDLTYS